MPEIRILFVEDDESLAFVVKDNLIKQGYEVDHLEDGASAFESFKSTTYDLCLLDVMLPKMDGFSLGQQIRQLNADVPIIYLTAKAMQEDRLTGFRSGGDDYITKPFSIEELFFRIEVFLKRNKKHSGSTSQLYTIGRYQFDHSEHMLKGSDTHHKLTQKEADLLKLFCENKNQTLKREDILIKIWGSDDYFLGRSLDVFVSKLRKYLSDDPTVAINNLHGVGFKLEAHDH